MSSCLAARFILIAATIVAEIFLADAAMIVMIAAAAALSVSLGQRNEARKVARALCEMNKAIRSAVSKSQQQ
jgi:hypothetical protein